MGSFLTRVVIYFLFQQVNFMVHIFQHQKIIIDNGIQKCKKQIIGFFCPNSTGTGPSPFPNAIKNVLLHFL